MDYTLIDLNLYVGSFPETLKGINTLKRIGATAVLNLQTSDDERYLKIDWTALQRVYEDCGIKVRRVPVRDFDPEDLEEKLPACIRELHDLLSSGHVVYLHCTAGSGRAPTVAIAYLSWHRGMTLTEAHDSVRSRRHCSPTIEAIRSVTRSRSATKT
jgi:protein-tyrosine phosphatase